MRDINKLIQEYLSREKTVQEIAKDYDISTRQLQRILKSNGAILTIQESWNLSRKHWKYHKLPKRLKIKRKQISQRTRYYLISKTPYCTICGARPSDGIRLEVDHINNNPADNNIKNLRVLCKLCNIGKSNKL